MRKELYLIFALTLPPGAALAQSPVVVSHTLTNYTPGADQVTLGYTLRVENRSAAPLYNLTLDYVPLPIASTTVPLEVTVGSLDVQAATEVAFTLTTPLVLSELELASLPLAWVGRGSDPNSQPVDFPVQSYSSAGGAP